MKEIKTAPAYSPLWKKLYSLVKRFVVEEPWELFGDEDTFIVQSPRDNQMYLCSVMGNAGEEFGLSAFRGAQGMRNFRKIVSRDLNEPMDRNLKFELDMLSLSFSPRDYMESKDLKVTRKLMLSFPGGRWPLIRSYRPHYFPWFLTELEIKELCDCLEQTLELLDSGHQVLGTIRNAVPGEMLVRCVEDSTWVSRKIPVRYPTEEDVPEVYLDDDVLRKLRNLPCSGPQEEIDLVHMRGPIQDHEPPYFGLLLVGITKEEFANQYGLFEPFRDYFQEACNALAQAFLSRGAKPRMVVLQQGSPFSRVFGKIAENAEIQIVESENLPSMSGFLKGMDEAMAYRAFPDDEF